MIQLKCPNHWYGRDCLKEVCEEFPSEGNASDCHSVAIFKNLISDQ